MTKSDELDLLKQFAARMPKHGYVGPFLNRMLPQLENDMRCDIETIPDVAGIQREVLTLRASVKEEQRQLDAKRRELAELRDQVNLMQERKVYVLHELDNLRKELGRIIS
jgi:uncharacterized membrane protein